MTLASTARRAVRPDDYLADTLDATRGRTVHAYHVEGGGGHPDLLPMTMTVHGGDRAAHEVGSLSPGRLADIVLSTVFVADAADRARLPRGPRYVPVRDSRT